jgi:uncharacterized protein (DUF1330 family)
MTIRQQIMCKVERDNHKSCTFVCDIETKEIIFEVKDHENNIIWEFDTIKKAEDFYNNM